MRPPRFRRSLTLSSTLSMLTLAAVSSSPIASGEETEKAVAKSCLYQNELRTTKALDDRTILFTTRDGQTYRNTLPRQCPSMRRGSLLNYTYEGRRICAGGTFQVLLDFGGGRHMPTVVCPLGIFAPITEDEAQDLIATLTSREGGRRNRRGERDMIRVEPADAAAPPPASPPIE
ncbi:MAG: hypothetical protein ABI640_20900 [Gammaproteobacteria bacterium]